MNIQIYVLLFAIAFLLIYIGNQLNANTTGASFLGFTLILLLGMVLMPGFPGSVEYQTGEIQTTDNVTLQVITENVYTSYNSATYGMYIMLMAIFMFISELIQLKGFRE